MFRMIFCSQSRTPPQDVQTGAEPCEPQRVDSTVRGSKKFTGCCSWLRHLFGRVPKKDRIPPPEKNGSKISPKKTFRWLPRGCRKTNRVAPAPPIEPEELHIVPPKLSAGYAPMHNDSDLPGKGKAELTENLDLPRIGFPNIGNTCYLNACLQGLLTLDHFIVRIQDQESVWRQSREAELLRLLHAITNAHHASRKAKIASLLHGFIQTVALKAPEFCGLQPKDAHEFLTTVLNQIKSLAPSLESLASSLGTTYTCPVKEMMFQVERTRTCKKCGMESSRKEDFTNLSLALFPDWSTERLLEHHLKETELEFRCECGGTISSQRAAFTSLPNILILHLKRLKYDAKFRLEKVTCPIHLNRDLIVSSKEDAACFSLVSIVSHLGSSAQNGHYICDGLDPRDNPLKRTDDWLTYNDISVLPSTGKECCRQRETAAYILFYKRITV